jgi:hypothetical protein
VRINADQAADRGEPKPAFGRTHGARPAQIQRPIRPRLSLKKQFGFERAAPGQRGSDRVAGDAAQTARHDQPQVGLACPRPRRRRRYPADHPVVVPNQATIVLQASQASAGAADPNRLARSLAQSENRFAAECLGPIWRRSRLLNVSSLWRSAPLSVPIHSPPSCAGKSAVIGEPGNPSALVKEDTFPSLNRCKAPARVPAQTVPCASAQTARTQSSDRPLAVE